MTAESAYAGKALKDDLPGLKKVIAQAVSGLSIDSTEKKSRSLQSAPARKYTWKHTGF